MIEQWNELKETIIELRDNDGTANQQQICKFLANYMDILEKQMKTQEYESLSDKEQRIFLSAMTREEKVCKEIDWKYPNREPYEESLMSICRSIERKVKKALWR